MEIRSTADWHTPSFADSIGAAKSTHSVANPKTLAETINDDIKQSLQKGQEANAQNTDPKNVSTLMGSGTALNIMA